MLSPYRKLTSPRSPRDRRNNRRLRQQGRRVLTVLECEARDGEKLRRRIERSVLLTGAARPDSPEPPSAQPVGLGGSLTTERWRGSAKSGGSPKFPKIPHRRN